MPLPFVQVPTAIFRDPGLTANAKAVYVTLATYADLTTRDCTLNRGTIARDMGLSRGTVDRALKELQKAGLVEIENRKDERGVWGASRYTLRSPHGASPQAGGVITGGDTPTDEDTGITTGDETYHHGWREGVITGDEGVSSRVMNIEQEPIEQEPENEREPSSSQAADAAPDQKPDKNDRDDVRTLCQTLADLMVKNGCKPPTITKTWLNAARLLLDVDRRDYDKALALLRWSQADPFWSTNIHSMPTFRAKYDKLRMRAVEEWERGRTQASNGNGRHNTDPRTLDRGNPVTVPTLTYDPYTQLESDLP